MEIKGKVHCMFEQSGTFRDAFKHFGFDATCYDIQNEFGQTDNVVDLFKEIDNAYDNKPSKVFDVISPDDLVMAFFPCIYFTGFSNPPFFCGYATNYKGWSKKRIVDFCIDRSRKRQFFYEKILKFVGIAYERGLRIIIENPYSASHFLHNNFVENPKIVDVDRTSRGDVFKKPTGYWFVNCEPTHRMTYDKSTVIKTIEGTHDPHPKGGGICGKERSLITPSYAKNFISDFIIGDKTGGGKEGKIYQQDMFDIGG